MVSLFDGLFLAAIVFVLLYLYLSLSFSYWKKRGISYDKNTSVIFGSLTDAMLGRKCLGAVYQQIYENHPGEKVVGWFKFRAPGIMVRDPELVHKILVPDFHNFRNNDFDVDSDLDPIMGNNLFVLKDELWKKGRALITPAFTAGKIKAIYPVMKEVSNDLISYLKKHPEELHIKSTMSRYTSEIVARCALGIEGKNLEEPKPVMHEMGKLIFEPNLVKNLKMISFFVLPKLTKFLRLKMVPDHVLQFFDSILRDVIIHRQEHNIERNDLIQYWLDVKKKTIEVEKGKIQSDVITKVYSDDDVLSGCIMFFIEGYETSAVVLNNILYHLALYKDVQEKLRDEIDAALLEGEMTFDKLHSLNYLHSVYVESNRLLPVMFTLQKVCTENYEMDIGKEKPLLIEKGTSTIIPNYGLQTDPLYWEDPLVFKPERFANKEEGAAKAKGIYLPFGDGPRMCPGSRIATTIVKQAIVEIVSKMEILPTNKTPKKIEPDPNYFMIAHKGGIYLKFVERSN